MGAEGQLLGVPLVVPGKQKLRTTASLTRGEAALQLKDTQKSAWSNYVFIIIPKLLCHKSHFPSRGVLVQSCRLPFPSLQQLTAPAGPREQQASPGLISCHTGAQAASPAEQMLGTEGTLPV